MNRTKRLISVILGLSLALFLTSCAGLLEFDEGPDLASVDRGYQEEECDTGTCTVERVREDKEIDPVKVGIRRAVEARDVVLGMTRNDVMQSWGAPAVREVAGRRNDGHERWVYGSRFSLQGERTVIFENGQVAGWYR